MTPQTGNSPVADYDVVIIGSGAAACAAAIDCRRFNLSVLIITRQKNDEPIDAFRPSESLHPGIAGLLNHLGALSIIDQSSTGTYHGIKTNDAVNYFSNDKEEPSPGHHINKSVFNPALLQLAVSRNVSVLFNERVTDLVKDDHTIIGVKTNKGRTVIAKYTIDASGEKRTAGKLLGLKEYFFSPPLIAWSGKVTDINSNDPLFDKHLAYFIPKDNGWTWLAPETDNACTFTCLTIKGKQSFTIPAELEGKGILQKIIKYNMRWRMYKTVAMEGLIICGDAAAIIDPAAGQGTLQAVYSGIKAAETIAQCLNDPEKENEFLTIYSDWFNHESERKTEILKGHYDKRNIGLS